LVFAKSQLTDSISSVYHITDDSHVCREMNVQPLIPYQPKPTKLQVKFAPAVHRENAV